MEFKISVKLPVCNHFAEKALAPSVSAIAERPEVDADGDELLHEGRDVTPSSWGERFQKQGFVSRKALRLIAKQGGRVSCLSSRGSEHSRDKSTS